jgi:hypothetical protein
MTLRESIPPTVLVALRLLRTRLTMAGLLDPAERASREAAASALRGLARGARSGQRVLVFSLRGGWYPHTAWEALLARGLDVRGADVHVFNCGGRMPICEVNFRHADPRVACAECASYPATLATGFQLSRSWLRDYVSAADDREIRAAVARLDSGEYERWQFDGQPIGGLVRNSVLWFLRKSRIESTSDFEVYRDFLIAGAQIARLAPRLIAATRPDIVIELNGLFFAEQVFNRFVPPACRLVTYEAGWRSNSLGFDDLSEHGFADLDEAWRVLSSRPLTPEESARLDAWIRARGGGDMQRDFYVRFDAGDARNPLQQLGLDAARPTAVLFTNLVWDTAVFGRDIAFGSIEDWLRRTVDWFAQNPDRQLVIRIHPAEDLRPSQESHEKVADIVGGLRLPSNVHVVPSQSALSSYRLIEAASAVLVYNSTAGIEAALRGLPVVVAARVYYARRGFTRDVDRLDEYEAILDAAFRTGPLGSDALELARRFANLLLFRFLHDVPVVKQRPRTFPLLSPAEVPLAAAGSRSDFDALLGRILTREPLVRMS